MRIGLLGATDGLEQADGPGPRAHQLVEAAGHEPVALTLEKHDLHRVGAVWLPHDPGPGWRNGAALMSDLALAIDRGMPLLATGAGVVATIEVGLLPGLVTAGRGGRRTLRVESPDSSWTVGLEAHVEMQVQVDAAHARWSLEDLGGARVVARWLDDPHEDVAALASPAGNVVGLLAELHEADLDSDSDRGARSWLASPTAMLDAEPLVPIVRR